MTRPKPIATFEQLYLLAVLIEVASIVMHWSQLAAAPPIDRWSRLAAVPIVLLLVLLTARWRSRVAALAIAALFLISLPAIMSPFVTGAAPGRLLPLVLQLLLQVGAFAMLLRPASRGWLAGRAAPPVA